MTLDLAGAWTAVTDSPLFGITLTLLGYEGARRISRATRGNPLANPVLLGIVLVGAFLLVTRTSYADYLGGAQYIAFLLGPATVALALPLYREAARMGRSGLAIVTAVTLGSATAIVSAVLITRALGGSEELALSMAPKSATTPVSIALSEQIGGIPPLTAAFTILAGVLGAVTAPHLLDWLRVRDERVRGLATGVVSHGIGASRLLETEPPAAAFAALAMALNAVVTTALLPFLLPLLGA